MSEVEFVKIAGTLVIGGGIGLGGKIIFEWLKERHNEVPAGSAQAQANANGKTSQKDCNRTHREVDGRLKDIDICLVQHKGMIEAHEKRLDKGDRDFEAVQKSISGLDKSYAVLASKLK